jgi:hypothetical protein
VNNKTKTANVLVWITKLGTTDGQSRTSISDITLEGARPGVGRQVPRDLLDELGRAGCRVGRLP